MSPQWLPDKVNLEDYDGNWQVFFESVYDFFHRDFVDDKPFFRGRRLGLKRHPEYDGKSATFWHMISEGRVEDERTPDLRRCERIRWPSPIIENSTEVELKVWAEPKGQNQRILIWFESEGYLVVLEDRREYILPWTAYYVEYEHQRRKYTKRWKKYKDNGV